MKIIAIEDFWSFSEISVLDFLSGFVIMIYANSDYEIRWYITRNP